MANVTTIDITPFNGSDKFPVNANDVYKIVETIASQRIAGLKSTNRIANAFKEYAIDGNGAVIEEAVIEMAEAGNFVKTGQPDLSPTDPKVHVKYFNNWETKQFKTTIRREDIRKVIANKGAGLDEVVATILDSLTEGEGYFDYTKEDGALKCVAETCMGIEDLDARFNGRHVKNMKGVIWAIREMFSLLTDCNLKGVSAVVGSTYKYSVDPKDVRIAISESVLNLIDVTELANVFNLQKEELMGIIVPIPYDSAFETTKCILAYDVNALGRGTRLYEYTQDVLGVGLYTNHYLTTERCYFYNDMYKVVSVSIEDAITTAEAEVLEAD